MSIQAKAQYILAKFYREELGLSKAAVKVKMWCAVDAAQEHTKTKIQPGNGARF